MILKGPQIYMRMVVGLYLNQLQDWMDASTVVCHNNTNKKLWKSLTYAKLIDTQYDRDLNGVMFWVAFK